MITIATHSGSFHADDVFAVAALGLFLGPLNLNVVRTRDEEVISAADWVVDVGGVFDPATQRFDHHQNGAPVRENGIPYAAFGLVWDHIGAALCGSETVARRIEERLVFPIDAADNGVELYTLTEHRIAPFGIGAVFHLLGPEWDAEESVDEAFMEAVVLARRVIERAIVHGAATERMHLYADETYARSTDHSVLVFDVPMPQEAVAERPDVKVMVCPSDRTQNAKWHATAVRIGPDSFATRVAFPEAWAGLRDGELAVASGIPDAIFCHKKRFLFVAKSKEGAIAAAQYAVSAL